MPDEPNFLNPLISALAGLAGVGLGGWLTYRRERQQRRTDFLSRQLSEFYGPLVSLRAEILARSELRLKIEQAVDGAYMSDLVQAGPDHDARARVVDAHLQPLRTMIEDENETFRTRLMPLYQQMVENFRDKIWLAEPETREFFPKLVEFVEVWERVLRQALPRTVPKAIGHTEENLKPFYANLYAMHDRLRSEIAQSSPRTSAPINWRRGLLRLWIVAMAVWLIAAAIKFELPSAAHTYWDFWSIASEARDTYRSPPPVLDERAKLLSVVGLRLLIADAHSESFLQWGLAPPVLVLILGCAVGWAVRRP